MAGRADEVTRQPPAVNATLPREGLRGRTVVVALDQGDAAPAVTCMAHELARTYGSVPCVIRAFDVGAAPHAGRIAAMLATADALMGDALHESQRRAVRSAVLKVLGEPVAWPVHVHPGRPADVIVHEAAEREAALIVLGLRRHGMFDRVVRDETALNVVRRADCTVLAVTPALRARPATVVVGMDFTPASMAAARMAAMLVVAGGTLMLVHVRAGGDAPPPDAGAASPSTVDAAFDAVDADLGVPAGTVVVHLTPARAPGDGVATALLAIASEHQAELIAVGSRRHDWLDRAFEESVSTELVRDGRRSVLVVPPPPHRFAHEIHLSMPEARHVDDHE